MTAPTSGSLRLFRALGIDVYLHWSWFLVAFLQVSVPRSPEYQLGALRVLEYVCLFGIVLLHEYGHALACRQVGGEADTIVLWPLGGIAYVSPPPRPGAVLWSVAAGPLVNVVLLVPTWWWFLAARANGWEQTAPDWYQFSHLLAVMNLVLLIFNMIPAYPLDGGQVLWALLWFQTGRWAALLAASVVGIGFSVLLGIASLGCMIASPIAGALMAFMAIFAGMRSLAAFHASRHYLHIEKLPRHMNCACPRCGVAPPAGPFWSCEHCQARFDLFDARGRCPSCGAWYLEPHCPDCHEPSHVDRWFASAADRVGTGGPMPTHDPGAEPPGAAGRP